MTAMDVQQTEHVPDFPEVAFRTLFLQMYNFKNAMPNFFVLYKIRRYVDSYFEGFNGASLYEIIAEDIKAVKKISDPYAREIVHSWMSLWDAFCKVDFAVQQNDFWMTAREYLSENDDLGVCSYIIDGCLVGPILYCRWSDNPNATFEISGIKIEMKATRKIEPGELVTFPKCSLVIKGERKLIQYPVCKRCKQTYSIPLSEGLPFMNYEYREKYISDPDVTDMEKKVYDELYHTFHNLDCCYKCAVHRSIYYRDWPSRERIVLSNEIAFQSWAPTRLLTIENPNLLRKCEEDAAHAYISEDEYMDYMNKSIEESSVSTDDESFTKTTKKKPKSSVSKSRSKSTKSRKPRNSTSVEATLGDEGSLKEVTKKVYKKRGRKKKPKPVSEEEETAEETPEESPDADLTFKKINNDMVIKSATSSDNDMKIDPKPTTHVSPKKIVIEPSLKEKKKEVSTTLKAPSKNATLEEGKKAHEMKQEKTKLVQNLGSDQISNKPVLKPLNEIFDPKLFEKKKIDDKKFIDKTQKSNLSQENTKRLPKIQLPGEVNKRSKQSGPTDRPESKDISNTTLPNLKDIQDRAKSKMKINNILN
eukprot:NODE_191_length_13422_cov_1.451025.p3 type:complete len:589 gc:universal NODE_191_length_13422_cov_1.451025:3256-1490(-)